MTLNFSQCIQQCLDPAEYGIYRGLEETQNHGGNSIKFVLHTLNNKRDSNGMRVGHDYPYQRVYSEYEFAKKALYSLRNFEPGVNKLYLR